MCLPLAVHFQCLHVPYHPMSQNFDTISSRLYSFKKGVYTSRFVFILISTKKICITQLLLVKATGSFSFPARTMVHLCNTGLSVPVITEFHWFYKIV